MKPLACLLLSSVLLSAADDPSLVPLRNQFDGATQKYSERLRILADLDGDGVEDMLLSGGHETSGTAGGAWTVYLNRNGVYSAVGDISAHPKAIAIEPDQDRIQADAKVRRFARIWVYLKSSGRNGSFGYYRIGNESVDEIKAIKIYPGDGGTDLGRSIYKATFEKSPIPFKIQQSTTSDEGKVTWTESKR
ncbi:MAG: hypothetical protein J0M04_10525 [Verrucomicrobia bacterium]|nr:hypothetical protein [Verrucomicrobiota bacterium]